MNMQPSPQLPRPDGLNLGEPLRLAGVCLDANTAENLINFVRSIPLARLETGISKYLTGGESLLERWAQPPALDICLIDFDESRRNATISAETVRETLPHTAIFAVSADSEPDLIIQAMHSGCNEYLIKPIDHDQLLAAIARVGARKKEKQVNGQVVTLLGAKGGVGTTVVATHLGALLARSCSRRTLLVDLHPTFGDAELYLGLTKYQYSFRQLAENADRLDADLLQSFLLHHPSGLDLLPAPDPAQPVHLVSPDAIGSLIDFLRLRYEFVLLDCPPGLSDDNLQALRRSDQVYVIAVSDVSSLRNVIRYSDYFARSSHHQEVRLVLNRHSKRNPITDEQVEKAIHNKVFWKVPNQYNQVVRTINDGDPSSQPGSEVARTLLDLARTIASQAGPKKDLGRTNKGLLALLGG